MFLDDETLQQPVKSLLIILLNALYKSHHLPVLLISNYQYTLKHTSGMCAVCDALKKMLKKKKQCSVMTQITALILRSE